MKILALDLSTTVIGYSVFETEDGSLKVCEFYCYESDDLVDKGFEVRNLLLSLKDRFDYEAVVIEERLKKFTAGRTNADAMFKTAQLNYITQFICRDLGYSVKELNVNTARSLSFPGFHTIARARKDVKQKEVAFEMAIKILGDGFFPKKVLKSGPRKGMEVYLEEARDMCDSWVLGRAYLNSLNATIRTGVPAGPKRKSSPNKKK